MVQGVFGDYYLEIQRHPIPELEQINQELISLSTKLNIPPVATFDVHYVDKKDAPAHELLLCIQTNTTVYDEKRLKMAGDFFYLKSPEEVEQLFADLPQAVENTQAIADMCQLELDFTKLHLPQVELPRGRKLMISWLSSAGRAWENVTRSPAQRSRNGLAASSMSSRRQSLPITSSLFGI